MNLKHTIPTTSTSDTTGAGNGLLIYQKKFSIPQASKLIGISPNKLTTIIREGQIPIIKVDGKTLLLEKDIEDFLNERYGRVDAQVEINTHKRPALPENIADSEHLK